ncbi:MAG TPA: hypothetical protein ACFYD3_06475 [Candidatus Hypogeohydataceae bacterium YC41]
MLREWFPVVARHFNWDVKEGIGHINIKYLEKEDPRVEKSADVYIESSSDFTLIIEIFREPGQTWVKIENGKITQFGNHRVLEKISPSVCPVKAEGG